MNLLDCIYCAEPVGLTDAWEDMRGVLRFDIHIVCGRQFVDIPFADGARASMERCRDKS